MNYEDIGHQVVNQMNWTSFANEEVRPVAEDARILAELRDRLSPPERAEATVGDAVQQDARIRAFLLGGITEEGEVPGESLSVITEQFLGVALDDPNKWVNAEQEGLTGDDYVAITTIETDLVTLLQTADEQLTAVLQNLETSPPVVDDQVETLLNEPEKTVDVLQRFLTGMLQLTANTCPFTFFAYTTQAVTARYLTEAYPPLQSQIHDVAGSVGLQKLFIPGLEDEDRNTAYTVWGHKEDGVLDRLYRVNQAVWSIFNDETARSTLSSFFSNVPNPQEDFTRRVEEQLTVEDWSYPEYLPVCVHPNRVPTSTANSTDDPHYKQNMDLTKAFIIEDGTITAREAITEVNTSSIVHRRKDIDEVVSLLRYLDEVMPGVFLGVCNFETVEHQANDTPQTGVRVYHA